MFCIPDILLDKDADPIAILLFEVPSSNLPASTPIKILFTPSASDNLPTTLSFERGVVVPIPTFPELEMDINVLEPEVIVNDPVPRDTEADILPVEI